MSNSFLESVDWELLLTEIKKSRCVLFLGPDLLSEPGGSSFQQRLKNHLEKKNGKSMPYYSADEFFSFQRKAQKRRTYHEIQHYFESQEPSGIHHLLAEIPFHLILSLSPDHLLPTAFDLAGFNYSFDFYKMGKNPVALSPPNPDKPLIYNLLGSAQDDHSLIFCYEDLFEYFQGIFGNYDLPDTLRDSLLTARHFIFLGIQYDKWYLKLLLRLLKLHEEKVIDACSLEGQMVDELRSFYTEHFVEINFLESGVDLFVNELHRRCTSRDLLRKPGGIQHLELLNRVQISIGENHTLGALDHLKEYAEHYKPELLSEIALIAGQTRELEQQKRNNLINWDEASLRQAQLNNALLSLAQTTS